ncbi:uncharacterized protein SAPINGB_P005659 [Magnusiomyces paraingens]|uniref:PX domain-containing protein n=1 Tax=Magnusiomyces paraingens TaxID=2606893 RepID=A0A5E8C367_9ASCO|nr:uncharacterized protein SAPINGB_P005659 [Saprochaete ingens]VVT57365.1 unnamed protein product [Saprochaete ingens]
MSEDDLDIGSSHWGDAFTSVETSNSTNNSLKKNGSSTEESLPSSPNDHHLPNSSGSQSEVNSSPQKSKHYRISTLRSSRFNKKSGPKVQIESVPVTDPLGPLGGNVTDSEPIKTTLSYALFGEDAVQPKILQNSVLPLINSGPSELVENVSRLSVKEHSSTAQINQSSFDITVGDPIKVGELTSAHTVYTVHTKTNSPKFNNSETSVTRRYKDFRWLYHALENNNPGVIIPPPPEKQAVGRFNEDFVESRRSSLETMLNKCASHSILQNDPDFRIFLESETFSTDIKSKQYQAQTSTVNGGVESKGFMGLGGHFSFSGKYVETDEWFLEKKAYVDSLESQFKYLEKSLDMMVTQRKELSDATAEFGAILNSLSNVELSKSFGELIDRFSSVESRVRDLYFRQCMQDILSLGSTLEEYIRLIASIRNVFIQRQKAYFSMQLAEQELSKKRQNLEKVKKQAKTLQDKISYLTDDVNEQEKKVINLRVAFDDISKLIISEFSRFEQSKANDFRNSVELYLENAVEAQKEAIEIWETFYQLSGFSNSKASNSTLSKESEVF